MTAKRKPSDALRGIRRAEPDRPFDEMTAAQAREFAALMNAYKAPRPSMLDIAAEIEKLPWYQRLSAGTYVTETELDLWLLLQRLAAAQKGTK